MFTEYIPNPIFFSQNDLPIEMVEHIEEMAMNVHEVWASGRIDEGWVYGEKRNDFLKEHPNLLPYCELPEIEKEYDRRTVLATLSYLVSITYRNNL